MPNADGRVKRRNCSSFFHSSAPSRVLLVLLLVGFSLQGAGCATPPTEMRGAASLEAPLAALLSRAIQIETVNPPGDEKPLAEYFVSVLHDAGIESPVIDTPNGDSILGRARAWGVVRGTGDKRPVVLLSHLDVVPADARKWQDAPFGGVVRDGYVIGRGALDAKGVGVVHLMTMLELARRDVPPDRDVIFLATPDEETGAIDGAGYITRHRTDLLANADGMNRQAKFFGHRPR